MVHQGYTYSFDRLPGKLQVIFIICKYLVEYLCKETFITFMAYRLLWICSDSYIKYLLTKQKKTLLLSKKIEIVFWSIGKLIILEEFSLEEVTQSYWLIYSITKTSQEFLEAQVLNKCKRYTMDWHKDIEKFWILTLMVPNDSFISQ